LNELDSIWLGFRCPPFDGLGEVDFLPPSQKRSIQFRDESHWAVSSTRDSLSHIEKKLRPPIEPDESSTLFKRFNPFVQPTDEILSAYYS